MIRYRITVTKITTEIAELTVEFENEDELHAAWRKFEREEKKTIGGQPVSFEFENEDLDYVIEDEEDLNSEPESEDEPQT
jgi:hypothetical protein